MQDMMMHVRAAISCSAPAGMTVQSAYQRETIGNVNLKKGDRHAQPQPYVQPHPVQQARPYTPPQPYSAPRPVQQPKVSFMRMPELANPVERGQKTQLFAEAEGRSRQLDVCFGWNTDDLACDMDASAFLLTDEMRVMSDDWFVFYGQTVSPDGAAAVYTSAGADREKITLDLRRLERRITRIVFVLTIDEALEKGLDFGRVRDLYMRVLDPGTGRELVSFRPDASLKGITSMTMGEIYLKSGMWRFNPVGNGVKQDLAGQCGIYGVQIC